MRVLAIAFVYNELPYLPFAVNYYREQGCELYVIDNYSKDGTWEWLQENKIPSHRFDSKEAFQLAWLQGEMIKTLHILKPDWFLWFAPDLFHVFDSTIYETIGLMNRAGFNLIKSPCYSIKNTGEKFGIPLQNHYGWGVVNNKVLLVGKYHEKLTISGDGVGVPDRNVFQTGVIFEYGTCKPKEVQEEKLRRREKAWTLGTPHGHGGHYRRGKELDWVYPTTYPGMEDVRQKPELQKYLKKIIK